MGPGLGERHEGECGLCWAAPGLEGTWSPSGRSTPLMVIWEAGFFPEVTGHKCVTGGTSNSVAENAAKAADQVCFLGSGHQLYLIQFCRQRRKGESWGQLDGLVQIGLDLRKILQPEGTAYAELVQGQRLGGVSASAFHGSGPPLLTQRSLHLS